MRTRQVTLVSRKAYTASDVIDKTINIKEPITAIDIIVRATNGAAMTEASTVKIHDDITKIELVDGSNVLYSTNMEEAQAINALMNKAMPYQQLTLEDGAVQTEMARVQFGFTINDPNHYLRPSDFDNLQIKVTVTMTTAAATAWAASGHDVTIIAHVLESGYGDYQGFLSSKSVKSYSAVDGAEEDIELNSDYPYNAIYIQAFKTATRPDENIEIVKLSCDDDSHVELQCYMTELEALNVSQFGAFQQTLYKRMTNAGDVIYADLFLNTYAVAMGGTTLYNTQITSVDCDQVVAETQAQT